MTKFNFDLIINYQKLHNLNITQFCQLANISKSVYYKLKHNNLRVNIKKFINICKLLGVKCEQLISYKKNLTV